MVLHLKQITAPLIFIRTSHYIRTITRGYTKKKMIFLYYYCYNQHEMLYIVSLWLAHHKPFFMFRIESSVVVIEIIILSLQTMSDRMV